MKELYIGLMSGTSMDAVDAALVDFNAAKPELIATHSQSIPAALKKALLDLCKPGHDEINRMGQLDIEVGLLFAETANQLLLKNSLSNSEIKAIGSHGQTIRHQPTGNHPFTLQIGDPNIIAEKTGITTLADFRRRDMAAGGQGAPLTPGFHNEIFRTASEDRIILNLGGIANITWLPANSNLPVIGFDTGPGNTLLDAWISKHLNKNHDEKGAWAASGKIDVKLLDAMLADDYFKLSHPKSTGREYFNLQWLEKILLGNHLQNTGDTKSNGRIAENIQATLCELTVLSIAITIDKLIKPCKILVCGGGIKNHYLIERLKINCPWSSIHSTDEYGVPPQWLEAMAWAWLAKQTLNKKPGNLPTVTGASKKVILGAVYFQ